MFLYSFYVVDWEIYSDDEQIQPTHRPKKSVLQNLCFRVRFGAVQVVNNDYTAGWGKYAIGGSEDPTILSQGNYFNPAGGVKEVTKRIDDGGPTYGGWQRWNWGSTGDVFLGGAYFTGSGAKASSAGVYSQAFSVSPRPGSLVPALTASAGPLSS